MLVCVFIASSDLNLINSAINEIQQKTCVRFTPRTIEKDYIEIVSKSGCSSLVGRSGGKQEVSLGGSSGAVHCMVKGIIIHELLHALG
jgi:Astacin (Peptidase family M12A)